MVVTAGLPQEADASLQDKHLDELLKEQRIMAQQCMDFAKRCMAFNDAIAQRIATNNSKFNVYIAPVNKTRGDTPDNLQKPLLDQSSVCPTPSNRKSNTSMNRQTTPSSPAKEIEKKNTMFGGPGPAPMSARDRIVEALKKKTYNVEDFYKTEGFAQSIARWEVFQNVVLGVIAINALWMAYETDNNHANLITDAAPVFQIGDNFFTLFFLFEITVRFCAFAEKGRAFKDGWFVFDFTLVSLMVLETYIEPIVAFLMGGLSENGLKHLTIFRLFRLLRLARVGRLMRLLRAFPELLVLTKAMFYALRSLGATCSLLSLTLFVFSIMFTQLLSGTETGAGLFDTVPQSFNTLLMTGVFTEQKETIQHMLDGSFAYYLLIIGYLVVASYTVLNMLIGVICEVISEVAAKEKEDILLQDLKGKITKVAQIVSPESFKEGGDIGDMEEQIMVSPGVFGEILQNSEACQALHEVGVDVVALADLSGFFFPQNRQIELTEFLQLILQFRGSNTATVKDIVDMRRFMVEDLKSLGVHP